MNIDKATIDRLTTFVRKEYEKFFSEYEKELNNDEIIVKFVHFACGQGKSEDVEHIPIKTLQEMSSRFCTLRDRTIALSMALNVDVIELMSGMIKSLVGQIGDEAVEKQ